ncbi:MAG: hypothetical protein DWQ10_09140 [Calditrichaeota bacterium]|nr:MAG: hypothetical protein DWQ10_09140 [Calditrichota bacterium]
MNHGTMAINLVFDDFGEHSRLPFLTSPQFNLHHIDAYTPDNTPSIFIVDPSNADQSLALYEALPHKTKASSVVTGRVEPDERPPLEQPGGTIFIHNCNDKKFLTWINLIAARRVNFFYLDWFVPLRVSPPYTYNEGLLIKAFDSLPVKHANEIQRKYLEKTVHCSSFKLDYLCKQIYGITPGKLLRIWRYFALTHKFMIEEAQLGSQPRRGRSPLRTIENDYCEALIRLLKISYSDLRLAAQDQHWIALWVAALRKVTPEFYKTPTGTF